MAFITLDETLPGMRSLLAFHSAIAPPLTGLMKVMMRSDQGLNQGERELIATFVSALNQCTSCENIHGAVACQLNDFQESELQHIKDDFNGSSLSLRLKALLDLAQHVQRGGRQVTEEQINHARITGCSDLEIHDTVLISALFCMFNRYIDGLRLQSFDTPETLNERGRHIAFKGYGE